MIHDNAAHQSGVSGSSVLHLHEFHHVQVKRLVVVRLNGEHSVDADLGEFVGNAVVQFGPQGRSGNVQEILLRGFNGNFQAVQDFQSLGPGKIESLGQHPRMEALGDVEIGLLQQLADENHCAGGSVASHVVLSSGGSGDERRRWMLDLHLVEQDIAVLGDFDVTGTRDQPSEKKWIVSFSLK